MRFRRTLYPCRLLHAIITKGPLFPRLICQFILSLIVAFCLIKIILYSARRERLETFITIPHDHKEETNVSAVYISQTNISLAEFLYKEVRVFCWVMTYPNNHAAKARHVQRTWGKRCNKLIFMSSAYDKELNSVALPVKEGYRYIWEKTKMSLKYLYKHHLDDADWFLKADDDTYVIVENLRYMLYPYSSKTPLFFGCKFHPWVKDGYMSGGAGYVLSREAVRRFIELALPNPAICEQASYGTEDLELGNCLANVKVIHGNSRDQFKRGRFFPLAPEDHLLPGFLDQGNWLYDYLYYKTNEGLDCCSDYAITFHYIKPQQMYMFDYLIYILRPYGITYNYDLLPPKLKEDELMPLSPL